MTNTPRDNWEVKPPRPVRYQGLAYFFVSFDAPRIEIERGSDGRRRVSWDGDDCWVTLQEPVASRTVRVHLQDNELEF